MPALLLINLLKTTIVNQTKRIFVESSYSIGQGWTSRVVASVPPKALEDRTSRRKDTASLLLDNQEVRVVPIQHDAGALHSKAGLGTSIHAIFSNGFSAFRICP